VIDSQDSRPRLKRTVEPIEAPGGDLILMRASGEDVRIPGATTEDRELLRALDGSRSVGELAEQFGAKKVQDALAQMGRWLLVEDATDYELIPAAERQRLDRQLRYFSDVAQGSSPSPAECQERLRNARVAILGAGGLGGRVALDLAAIGVGEIRIIDGDRVEVSNLNRQIQYTEADIGSLKAEVMADRLRAFNSGIKVEATSKRLESQGEIAGFIDGATFVVGSADWPPFVIEGWCNAACFAAGIPYIAMNQLPPFVRVGPLYVPSVTGCFECQMMRYRREHPLLDVAIEQRRGVEPQAATLSPTSGAIGALVSMEVMHFITGIVEPASCGVGLTFDFRDMTVEREPVIPERHCPVCGLR
jgi:bacteriocin biosynthesis cyclodehydratase domain-containing protein